MIHGEDYTKEADSKVKNGSDNSTRKNYQSEYSGTLQPKNNKKKTDRNQKNQVWEYRSPEPTY
jgi:hypothetical protein